jgi:hypothetical protein
MTKKRARGNKDEDLTKGTVDTFRRAVERKVGAEASFAEREAAALALATELCRADLANHENHRDLGAATRPPNKGTDDEDESPSGE